ncbi:MAG TPA: hypothetical protein VNA19_16000 [Pyrinomonadaceae bacterium]|nr:hypothetical protein [Pyrinomonadaceae bacterium]
MRNRSLAKPVASNQSQSELGRRIAGCRGRLRRSRATRKIEGRATASAMRREVLDLSDAFKCDARETGETHAPELANSQGIAESETRVLVECGAEKETQT